MALKPDFGPDDSLIPPLPAIKSEALRTQVFTHRSLHGRATNVFEDPHNDPSPDNERLEYLGDSVLNLVFTELLLENYPTLRVGPSTKLRGLVVRNINLASLSQKYKLSSQLRGHPSNIITLRNSSHVQADVFEAYVGGLFLDQSLSVVKDWLRPLLLPYMALAYRAVRQEHGLPATPNLSPTQLTTDFAQLGLKPVHAETAAATTGHLALFNQHIQKLNKEVEWLYVEITTPPLSTADAKASKDPDSDILVHLNKTTPVWEVKCCTDGEIIGRGRGLTKRGARNEAAKEGLQKLGIDV
ncbi:ribonuclease III [Flagelloscypha sp. PMI_526]|nr:ribonuclease III [Flagelloscypha sp. PMI_526]